MHTQYIPVGAPNSSGRHRVVLVCDTCMWGIPVATRCPNCKYTWRDGELIEALYKRRKENRKVEAREDVFRRAAAGDDYNQVCRELGRRGGIMKKVRRMRRERYEGAWYHESNNG